MGPTAISSSLQVAARVLFAAPFCLLVAVFPHSCAVPGRLGPILMDCRLEAHLI